MIIAHVVRLGFFDSILSVRFMAKRYNPTEKVSEGTNRIMYARNMLEHD